MQSAYVIAQKWNTRPNLKLRKPQTFNVTNYSFAYTFIAISLICSNYSLWQLKTFCHLLQIAILSQIFIVRHYGNYLVSHNSWKRSSTSFWLTLPICSETKNYFLCFLSNKKKLLILSNKKIVNSLSQVQVERCQMKHFSMELTMQFCCSDIKK